MPHGATMVLLMAALAGFGCGARREYYIDRLEVEQTHWDSLRVDVGFAARTALGPPRPLRPEEVSVQVFDADYQVLYRGGAGSIPVPDADLGNRERMLVEVCGVIRGREICVQEQEWASPKRVRVDQEITYPEGGDYGRGSYAFRFTVERPVFGGTDWERIDAGSDVHGYLRAWVGRQEQHAVEIPFTRPRGQFDLTRSERYRDFRYHLDASLLDEQQARVYFEVYAGLGGDVARLASVEREITLKSHEERREEVRHYAEIATERIIDALSTTFGARRRVGYVDGWNYEPATRRYRLDLEVAWHSGFFRSERLVVEGTLEVGEDGSDARFTMRSANHEAQRLWNRRMDGGTLELGRLPPASTVGATVHEPDGRMEAL